jgi:vancomycin resistance protein YoaR
VTHGRRLAQVGILVGAGVAIGLLVMPPAPKGPDAKAPPPVVQIVGESIDVASEKPMERALEAVRRYAAGNVTIALPGGATREVSRASLGAEIDRVYLSALVAQARDATSPMRREHAAAPTTGPLKLPTGIVVNATRAMTTLLSLKEELDQQPSDARMDLASRKLVAEKDGYRMDVYATLARIDEAFARGETKVDAAVEIVKPTILAAELGNVTFDDVIGWFETRYAPDKKHEARTYNLRLAASRLDGHIVVPNGTFDFNKIVGPRTEALGYKVAPVIAQGELVDGIGGGTCQIAGTLHGAVFFSGLEILHRTPHTRPSGYIKMGLDAAVAYPTINFRFKNPFPFPIVVHETVQGGVVRAEILGPRRNHVVTFVRKLDEVLPFQEVEKPDPKLPEGTKVLGQRGIPGFKLHRYRIVREGPFAVREQWQDQYPPTPQIIRVGTGTDLPKGMTLPADDQHPEYTADEFLEMTEGIGAHPGKDDLSEVREAGRTGVVGWTEKAGMSHWDPGKRDETDAESGKKSDKGDKGDKGDKRDRDRDRDTGDDPPKKKKRR